MPQVWLDSSVSRHPKFLKAGPAACWLYVCGLAYAQEGLTDGYITRAAIDHLGVVPGASKLAARLVDVGLWDAGEDGWHIHDYLRHNKSAAEVEHIREQRRRAGSAGGKQNASNLLSKQEASEEAKEKPTTNTTTNTSDNGRQRAPLHSSHAKCAACGRVCVPAFLHSEFVRRWPPAEDADRQVRDWYLAVEREWATKSEPADEPLKFWRARFEERWPPKPKAGDAKLPAWVQRVRAAKGAGA